MPAAVSVFPRELYQVPRSWAEQAYPKLVYFNELPEGNHFAAWQEPDASRFGGTLKGQYVKSVPSAPQEAAMGFQSTPENTDAIGALIVSQDRPLEAD